MAWYLLLSLFLVPLLFGILIFIDYARKPPDTGAEYLAAGLAYALIAVVFSIVIYELFPIVDQIRNNASAKVVRDIISEVKIFLILVSAVGTIVFGNLSASHLDTVVSSGLKFYKKKRLQRFVRSREGLVILGGGAIGALVMGIKTFR